MICNGSNPVEVFSPEGENGLYKSAVRYGLSGLNSVAQTQQPLLLLMLKSLRGMAHAK